MPVLVDCRKRNASTFIDDPFPESPCLPKRIRLSDAAALQLSPSSPPPSAAAAFHGGAKSPLSILRDRFPDLDKKLVERVFEASSNDLDFAIKCLNDTQSGSQARDIDSFACNSSVPPAYMPGSMVGSSGASAAMSDLPVDGSGWVELILRELTAASNMDDANVRASRILELLEKSITDHAIAEATEKLGKENKMQKEQIEALLHDNGILKRAVAIQHERQRAYDGQNEEMQQLKQMLAEHKEQLRALELNNYALSIQLNQAQQFNPLLGRFNPDVF